MSENRILEKNLKADVVVIGGGASGLAAAVTASEQGTRKVAIIEKRGVTGGNGIFANGIFVIEERADHSETVAARDGAFKEAMSYGHWKIDPRIIRALLEKSADTLQWLEAKGMRFDRREFPGKRAFPLVLPFYKGPEKLAGIGVTKTLAQECETKGVTILYNTEAKKLLVDKNGRVNGILAQTKDQQIRIETGSVVIATGGFAGNPQMLNKYAPYCHPGDFYMKGLPHQGDGIRIALEVGAASDQTIIVEMDGPDFPWAAGFFPHISGNRNQIWLNKKGERYVDESVPMFEVVNNINRQPGKISYSLFDENIKQKIFQAAVERPMGGVDKNWPEKIDNELKVQAGAGRVKIAGSLDEIAGWMGIASETLHNTVAEYNAFCNKGHDDDFAKDTQNLIKLETPPYYAVRCCLSILVTHGGIRVNHRMEVLNNDDEAIPGLFAAGVDIAGKEANTYNSGLPGHSFGFSVHSGRIAGENAAKYAGKT